MTDSQYLTLLAAAYIAPHLPKGVGIVLCATLIIAASLKGLGVV